MMYYLQNMWNYFRTLWITRPSLVEHVPDLVSEDSPRSVLIYPSEEESEDEEVRDD